MGRALDVTPDNVLEDLGNGSRTIWDLAAGFGRSAADPELCQIVRDLIDEGVVVASVTNLYSATLAVAQ